MSSTVTAKESAKTSGMRTRSQSRASVEEQGESPGQTIGGSQGRQLSAEPREVETSGEGITKERASMRTQSQTRSIASNAASKRIQSKIDEIAQRHRSTSQGSVGTPATVFTESQIALSTAMSSLGQGYSSGLSVTSREEQEYEPLLPRELTEEKATQEEEESPRGRALTKRPRSTLDTGISEPDWEQFQTALEINPEPEESERAEFTRIQTENRAL